MSKRSEYKIHLPGVFDKSTRCGKENSCAPIDGDIRFVTCLICLMSYAKEVGECPVFL